MTLVWLAACVVPSTPADDGLFSAAELWSGVVEAGAVAVGPVVVSSPRTASGGAFYVQDPGGGLGTGLRVDVGAFASDVPPAMGVEVELYGDWSATADGAPVVTVTTATEVVATGSSSTVVATPFSDDPTAVFAVASLPGADVSSMPDPTGRADLASGQDLVGAFAVPTPGYGSSGDLVAVVVAPGELALRTSLDWDGEIRDDPPVSTTIADIRSLPEGTPVALSGVQSAPWSADGRWTAIQDDVGNGLWVDGEAWGIAGSPEGAVADWTGEVRAGPEGLRLRTWTAPVEEGVATPVLAVVPADGARVEATITGLGPIDAFGDRASDGWIVDDRLAPLDALVDGTRVTGIASVLPGDEGALWISPFAW